MGTANPANHYHTGMLRFSDGTAYWDPVPITGGPQFIPVPQNATSFGYSMQGGAAISVTEVIGGTVFFSAGTQSVETLSDVQVAGIADGQLLAWNAGAGKWENVTPSAGGLFSAYLCYQDQKAQNTPGGTFTSGAWRQRDINTEVADTGNHGSVSANQITLDAGTYACVILCPAEYVDRHQARLWNVTAGTVLLTGTAHYAPQASPPGAGVSIIQGSFTLAVQSVLQIQHRSGSSNATNGFGAAANFGPEVYTSAQFFKQA